MKIATAVGNTNLAVAATNLAELGDVDPGGMAEGFVPSLAALAAAETVTLQIIRNDTGAVLGSAQFTNSGAGASTGGPMIVKAPIPQGFSGSISLQILASVATGNTVATANAPVTLSSQP